MDKLTSPQITRDTAGRFVKGCSGNYRGRPRINPQFRRLARENVEDAIIALDDLARNSKNDKIRLNAGCALIEAGMNTNLLFKFMKREGKTVWQYLYLPPESAKPADPPSEQVQHILAIRARCLPPLIDTLERQQKAIDDAEFEAMLS